MEDLFSMGHAKHWTGRWRQVVAALGLILNLNNVW